MTRQFNLVTMVGLSDDTMKHFVLQGSYNLEYDDSHYLHQMMVQMMIFPHAIHLHVYLVIRRDPTATLIDPVATGSIKAEGEGAAHGRGLRRSARLIRRNRRVAKTFVSVVRE